MKCEFVLTIGDKKITDKFVSTKQELKKNTKEHLKLKDKDITSIKISKDITCKFTLKINAKESTCCFVSQKKNLINDIEFAMQQNLFMLN